MEITVLRSFSSKRTNFIQRNTKKKQFDEFRRKTRWALQMNLCENAAKGDAYEMINEDFK